MWDGGVGLKYASARTLRPGRSVGMWYYRDVFIARMRVNFELLFTDFGWTQRNGFLETRRRRPGDKRHIHRTVVSRDPIGQRATSSEPIREIGSCGADFCGESE